ncbi:MULTISPECIES: hypothetical protein [Hymenobacter]|uniref:Antitoxin VbhA domain-containing protein n=1 Tax=Hymenobacter wooponensis TaxID=1525360 RepID=A0A4Z0MB67_9BACT|nr:MULTISPECIES: hypothetical protein [Hymenobacter]RPD43575.1 hypothetical protein DNI29_23540 [Hymenobacter sediminis]TGD76607.1 hypothetical protein EU557_25275 [Hymenobacter wooponensis]
MSYNPKFGPNAQTPAERANVLRQIKATNPDLVKKATPYVHRLYGQYVAGELSWEEVCALRDAPQILPDVYNQPQ